MTDKVFWWSTHQSTVPKISRLGGRLMCTNVHSHFWLEGRSTATAPVDPYELTVQRALLSRSGLVRLGGRPIGQRLLLAVSRSTDGSINC